MSIKQLTVFSLTFVSLSLCSVVFIGANHESQTKWEYVTYRSGLDEFHVNTTVYFSDTQITYNKFDVKMVDGSSPGDWSVYAKKPDYDRVTFAKGNKNSKENPYLLFLDALRKKLGGSGEENFTDINWTDFDTHIMNLLGSAGYEVVFQYSTKDFFNRIVLKRKIK